MRARWLLTAIAWILGVTTPLISSDDPARSDPIIEVRQQVPAEIDADSPVAVDVVVRNTGGSAAEDVTVNGAVPAGFEFIATNEHPQSGAKPSWSLGRLGSGDERLLHLQVRRKPDAADARLISVVEVSFRSRARSTAESAVRLPALSLAVTGPDLVTIGDTASFHITVRNTGTAPASDVTLISLLPVGLVHPGGNDLENTLGTLKAGEARSVDLKMTASRAGAMRLQVRAQAKGVAKVEETAMCRVEGGRLTLTAPATPAIEVNRPALHELFVANEGTRPVGKVELVLTLPKEIEFLRATDRGEYDDARRTVRWDLGELAPGAKRVVVWNGLVRSAGECTCRVQLRADGKEVRQASCAVRAATPIFTSEPRERR